MTTACVERLADADLVEAFARAREGERGELDHEVDQQLALQWRLLRDSTEAVSATLGRIELPVLTKTGAPRMYKGEIVLRDVKRDPALELVLGLMGMMGTTQDAQLLTPKSRSKEKLRVDKREHLKWMRNFGQDKEGGE